MCRIRYYNYINKYLSYTIIIINLILNNINNILLIIIIKFATKKSRSNALRHINRVNR